METNENFGNEQGDPRCIVALSGGKSSAWCADWALRNYARDQVVLYFNDTKWEHPDLYRFLDDLSAHLQHPITRDSDGRTVEQLFHDKHAIANNRMPFCSRILKAERLQRFYAHNDTLVFGIGVEERERANRIVTVYREVAERTGKWPKLVFPLIRESVSRSQIDAFLRSANIDVPHLYKLGFKHNNCSGGCVRAGKAHWRHLLKVLPDVYADRERMERDFQSMFGVRATIFRDESLEEFRLRVERGELSSYYETAEKQFSQDEGDDLEDVECVGICSTKA